ncbi:MAG: ABC transporter ATP-binding protein [Anaerolineaceae bacterium]|nr:ABC transporter ATP-binding protein [Anaerolineaceae bacterium]
MELPLQRYWALLAQYLAPLRLKVGLLAALIFSGIALQLVNPQFIRYFIDTATATGDTRPLYLAALTFLGASLLLQGISVAATYVGEDVGWQSTNQLRADLARHCLHLDMSFHNDRTPGEMIERIDGDVADIAIFFAQFVIQIVGNILLLIGVLIVLLWIDWRVSAALTVYTIIAMVAVTRLRQIAVPHWKAAREASADLFGFLEEHLAGTEDTRSSGAVPYVMRNLFKFNKVRLDTELKGATMTIILVMMWIGLFTLGQIVALISGYYLFQQGLLTIGTVYLIIFYTGLIFRPLREITAQFQNLQKAVAGIDRVESLITLESKIREAPAARPALPTGPLAVEFQHVTFSYVDDEPVLRDVSFMLEPGQVLGLLGRTGSGKTTLTRLIFRLYDISTGQIQLSGQSGTNGRNGHTIDIRQTTLADLRRRVGIVTQDVQLFRATVRDNLTFFDRSIPDEQILAVIDTLELGSWYNALPDGLDTELETEGHNLSAGEAQLLAFTRVFLQDPGLVILDEASSRLDPATEQLIERAVDKLLQHRTGIIVAHRLTTVERADQIMILENGRIRELGDYSALVGDPTSRFSQLRQTGLMEVLA